MKEETTPTSLTIPAITPHSSGGHQFVFYGDCCSGIKGAQHESTFASVNHIVSRLKAQPEFICFLGDEIKGLVADEKVLRDQWQYWFDHETDWLDREKIPLYHTTGNHTTYSEASEEVFRDVLAYLPQNGPKGQEGLSYFIRRNDLIMVFVNMMFSGLGDGRVETAWLDQTLSAHTDARYKLVLGHYPAYPINGFSGDYQRNLDAENQKAFWDVLVRHKVFAYICSHIMAFDVQVHEGVLQILTAGAGTLPHMPEDIEYLHCVQAALDDEGLRYQVLDTAGQPREWLTWPIELPLSKTWSRFDRGEYDAPVIEDDNTDSLQATLVAFRFDGRISSESNGGSQTFLCGWTPGPQLSPLWIGCQGPENRVTVLMSAAPGRSPHYWMGPTLEPGKPFSIQIAIHTGMGPGGLLWRWDDASPWSSLMGATPWGAERLSWQTRWSIGHDQYGPDGRPFKGESLSAMWHTQKLEFHQLI